MSRLVDIHCPTCGEMKKVRCGAGRRRPRTCDECANKAAQEGEDAHIAELAKLSIEERVERIERWIYNYQPPGRTGFEVIG